MIINRPVNWQPTPLANPAGQQSKTSTGNTKQNNSFASILDQKLTSPLQFSAHASKRLQERGISINSTDLQKLDQAATTLAGKGGKDALIVMDGVSYIVNLPNRTVVTAVEPGSQQAFTNIDSALLV